MARNSMGGAGYSTVSMDLPDDIQQLMNMPPAQPNASGVLPMGENLYQRGSLQTLQEGGMVQPPMGAGLQPTMGTGAPMNSGMLEAGVDETMASNPEAVARIRAGIEAGLAAGEITMQELNTAFELARTVMQNPALYPQLRQLIIQRGLATEADLPMEYDEGLVIAILAVQKAMQADVQFQNPQTGAQMMRTGMEVQGPGQVLKGPSHEQGGIPMKVAGKYTAEAEGGEFMIPKHIVERKGKEFFEKMLDQYKDFA